MWTLTADKLEGQITFQNHVIFVKNIMIFKYLTRWSSVSQEINASEAGTEPTGDEALYSPFYIKPPPFASQEMWWMSLTITQPLSAVFQCMWVLEGHRAVGIKIGSTHTSEKKTAIYGKLWSHMITRFWSMVKIICNCKKTNIKTCWTDWASLP